MSLLFIVGCAAPRIHAFYTIAGSGQVEIDNNELEVYLESNPTTGYQWSVEIRGSGLKLEESDFEAASDNTDGQEDTLETLGEDRHENAVGVGGFERFEFKGNAAGQQTITFTYERTFDPSEDDRQLVLETETDEQGNIIQSKMTEDGRELGHSKN